jgi:RNA polymerase sigma-70 factor (ECF subfamily)
MSATTVQRTIEVVWRIEQAKIIAAIARMVRDVGLAEEFAQDALVTALAQWPEKGVPDKPAAWLMATGKHRAIDHLRRAKMLDRKHGEIGYDMEIEQAHGGLDIDAVLDDDIGDDLLSLIFTACHPALSPEARVALTLKLIGGLATEEIARAFLVPEPTVAQRIVRAKRTLSDAGAPFEVPCGADRGERLSSVLDVIYLIFNEGYSATAGDDLIRPQLCEEAMRLGRILAGLAPLEPEVHGLVSLMEIQASRLKARTGPDGEPILLADQNRGKWDRLLIQHGLAALARSEGIAPQRGPYALQAAIAACHARARTADETDWPRIAALYLALSRINPSPVIELNRAVALSMAFGPQAGLDLADELVDEPALKNYHLLPSVRADFLTRLGRLEEAKVEFERAAAMTRNDRERALLLNRATAIAGSARAYGK